MKMQQHPAKPVEVPMPVKKPEATPPADPEEPLVIPEEDPGLVPDEDPYSTPPYEVPEPGEGP